MKVRNDRLQGIGDRGSVMARGIAAMLLMVTVALAQAVSTTTVQGTAFLANGQPGAGTLVVSWPAFTAAAGQAIVADSTTVTIAADGFVSVNLTPNLGATPAGEFYTAVFYMSDGTVNTEYWVVPAAAQASLAQVQAQVMPAAQAVQTVSKAYVDQSIAEMEGSLLTASGGTLTGPLYLNADPTQPMQAATKHYADTQVATAVPLAGGSMTGALTTPAENGVEAPAAGSGQTTLQAAMNAAGTNGALEIPPNYAGTDTFTNANGVKVTDWRTGGSQQTERSVKEFGAVCDGVTDDTNALQTALNYAHTHGVALTIPEGTCKTKTLNWRGESIGGLGKQVSSLMGFPGQDVLASAPDATGILSFTRLHDLTIYVDQSADASCSAAQGRAPAGLCQISRYIEENSIFSPGGNGLTNTAGTGAGWAVGNCAIAMPAATGAGGNGLKVAELENVEIAATGVDPMAAQYPGAHSTHTCGMYLGQWPQWSEFRDIDIRGLNTGIGIPALAVTAPAGLSADANRWQNVTIEATHAFTAAAGSNNVLDNVEAQASNSAATAEPPTGLVLDLSGNAQGWTVRNAVFAPTWIAVQPALTVTAAGGAVTAVTVGSEHGLGWDPYGASVPVSFSGSCTAQATAAVNANGSIGSVAVTQGGVGCSATTTASLNAAGTWDTAAAVNLIGGQNTTLFAGNMLEGMGGYTVWNASNSASYGTQLDGGGGVLPGGGTYAALVRTSSMGTTFQVDQFPGAGLGSKLQACINAVSTSYGGTCDARNFTGNLAMGSNVTIATGNTTVLLPCATISTTNQIIVTAGTRNVSLRGCALRGGSAASGSQGGTAFAYSGTGAMVQVGDPTYTIDTPGFHMDNAVINTTAATAATAQGLAAYRTQELDLEDLYFLGNANQTGLTLDGTGNYTGGTFRNDQFGGFQIAVNGIGHQVTNPATTDWLNASTFIRLHIDCPTNGGNPISGTYGINLQQGDGNTFTGGDVEGCTTALHLGPNAQNNTIVGLRNENSTNQVVADAGSSYNNWMTGGTMFTGKLTDSGTRNSFLDTFHRSFNGLNGDWYGSQQDATVTNHFRLGIGTGNERGLLNEIQTDHGYRWIYGFSDATGGQQLYQLQDLLNNVYRLQVQQWNQGQGNTSNQTALNGAGTGNVCFNCSTNAGTGGVSFASGGAAPSTVATIDNAGDAQFNGTLQVAGTSQSAGTLSVRNNADTEVDYYLWPGLTTSQKGSYTYKDWNGTSQWYMVKDASNNWALNSASGGLDSFKAYQSTNSGDTYIDTSNSGGHIRLNYETGSGVETDIYSGSSSNLDAAFLGPTSIKFPGLAATSGHFCLQVDNSGYVTNTGSACGTGSGGTSGTINSGNTGQIAYYTTNGTTVGGMSAVPVSAGGTGATSPTGALASLGGIAASGGTMTGALTAPGFLGPLTGNVTGTASGNLLPSNNLSDVTSASAAVSNLLPGIASDSNQGIMAQGNVTSAESLPKNSPYADIRAYGAVVNGTTDIGSAVQAAANQIGANGAGVTGTILLPCTGPSGCYWDNPTTLTHTTNLHFLLQGNLHTGTMLIADSAEEWEGDNVGGGVQFQNGFNGTIYGPHVTGTIGTAITSTNTPVTITPAFTNGNFAHLPVGVSMVIGTTQTVNATAVRTPVGGYGQIVFTLSGSYIPRFVVGEIATIAGCSDASLNISNIPIQNADYGANTVTIMQTTATATTATGCTLTSLDSANRESVRVLCSNGTAGTFDGVTYNQCGANQVTVYTQYTHAATEQFAENAVGPAFNTANPQEWNSLTIGNCYGDCFDAEGSTNLYMFRVGAAPVGSLLAGTMEFRNGYFIQIHNSALLGSDIPWVNPPCPNGGCGQPSYPYVLVMGPDPSGLFYQSATGAGGDVTIDDNSVIYGGVLLNPCCGYSGLPQINKTIFERAPGAAVTIDNRSGNFGFNCLHLEHDFLQDSLTFGPLYYVNYTNPEAPGGCANFKDDELIDTAYMTGPYFNGSTLVEGNVPGTVMPVPPGLTTPPGVFISGQTIVGEILGKDAPMAPGVLPYGSLPATVSASGWQSLCGTGCTVTAVSGPDGPNGSMVAATFGGSNSTFSIGTSSLATYAGDSFIYGAWVYGAMADYRGEDCGVDIHSANDVFAAPTGAYSNGQTACPSGFDTNLATNNRGTVFGWHPVIAIATVVTGNSTAHSVSLQLSACVASLAICNTLAQPFWAFIPGPNNPSYAGATNFNIMEARQDQYHGCVPPGVAAGQAATCEPINTGAATATSVTIAGAPSGSYVKADGTGYGTPSGSGITQLTGDVAAGPGSGPQAALVSKINGGAVPASAAVMGTNSSGQPVSATTTGSGNVVLATSPTIATPTVTGATMMQGNVTLQNGANSNLTLAIQPGTSADQIGAVQFNNYGGTGEWQLRKDATNYLRLTDPVNSLDRSVFYQNGNTIINAGAGSNAVAINNTIGSGTGGFTVYEGGANSSTAALQVGGTGNTTAMGFLQGKFMMGSGTMTLTAGAASGTSPTIACATSHVCDGVSGTVALTTGTGTTTGTLATLGFPNTHTNQANCIVTVQSGNALITTDTWSESTTAITIVANAAPATSAAYTIKYWCGGN